jgi:putative acetyltransferase
MRINNVNIIIREEQPTDINAIYAVEQDAFEQPDEADLVNRLRDIDAVWLSHIAVLDGDIVGHALYSMVTVTDGDMVREFPALAPLAIATTYQKQGIGGQLMNAGLQAARDAGYGLMFLIGHPSYYPRFGFQPAKPLGFTSDYVKEDGPHEHFMVAVLDDSLLNTVRGHVRYHSIFDGI